MTSRQVQNVVGIDVTATSATRKFTLGHRVITRDGDEYLYVRNGTTAVTNVGTPMVYREDFLADILTTANDSVADYVGFAQQAVTASHYFWLPVVSHTGLSVRVGANCADNAVLNTTATANLDDDGTAGARIIRNVKPTVANGGTIGAVNAIFNTPVINTADI